MSRTGRVVMPEDDPRIRSAADSLTERGIDVVPLADPSDAHRDAIRRVRPGMADGAVNRLLSRPMFLAGAMVAAGEADALVAGADTPTRRVIEAAAMTIGLAEGITMPSSFFLMRFPTRELLFADCAVNVAPDAAALADIARSSAASWEAMTGTKARIAMLSFSTGTSGSGASVERVRDATERLVESGVRLIGPVQADAALNPAIAAKKGLEAEDSANVLIFPDLDAGNIAYKLAQELAGAQAQGPVLQGFARPVCDLSRGARVDDIVAATELVLRLS